MIGGTSEVTLWLKTLPQTLRLDRVANLLETNGITSLDTIATLSVEDLTHLGMRKGHARTLLHVFLHGPDSFNNISPPPSPSPSRSPSRSIPAVRSATPSAETPGVEGVGGSERPPLPSFFLPHMPVLRSGTASAPEFRGRDWSTDQIVSELQKRITQAVSKSADQSRQAWKMFNCAEYITHKVLKDMLAKFDMFVTDDQVDALFHYIDTNGNGEIEFPEFCSRIMGEAYATDKRHAMSWLRDVEIAVKKRRELAENKMREAGSLAHQCSRLEQPEWQKSGKYKNSIRSIMSQIQEKIMNKTSKDADQLRQAFNLLGGNKGPITVESLKLTLLTMGIIVSDDENQELFELIDTDNSGHIDFYEFVIGVLPTDYGCSAFSTVPKGMQKLMQRRTAARAEAALKAHFLHSSTAVPGSLTAVPGASTVPEPAALLNRSSVSVISPFSPVQGKVRILGQRTPTGLGGDAPVFQAVHARDLESLALVVLRAHGGPCSAEALGARNRSGETVLHVAAMMGALDIIKWLLAVWEQHGCEEAQSFIHAKDSSGATPALVAQRHGNILAAKLLRKAEKRSANLGSRRCRSQSPTPMARSVVAEGVNRLGGEKATAATNKRRYPMLPKLISHGTQRSPSNSPTQNSQPLASSRSCCILSSPLLANS